MELKELTTKFLSIVDLSERLKGWLKLIMQGKVLTVGLLPMLKKVFKTSPQFLIYQDAVLLYFEESFDKEKARKIIRKWEEVVK